MSTDGDGDLPGVPRKPLTAADVRVALRKRFSASDAALVFEVAQGTGTLAHRHLDAIAMDLWPSRGLSLHGIEIKVNLYDWRREKATPEKAEQIARFCDYFWIAAPKGVVPVDELPAAWGLIEITPDGKQATTKRAEKTEAQPVTRAFMAAMLRASQRGLGEEDLAVAMRIRQAALEETFARRVEQAAQASRHKDSEAADHWRELVKALGEERPDYFYRSGELIGAVKVVMAAGVAPTYAGLRRLFTSLGDMHRSVGEAIGELKIPEPESLDDQIRRKRRA